VEEIMKAPRRLNGSRIAVGVASVGLTVGAFSLYSRKRYGRSAAASLAEYGVRPVKALAARIPMTERIARLADRPEPARTVTFPAWGRFFYDLERREDSGMPVYHLRPRTPSSAVIVYLHGGGYISTAVSAHAWLVDHLARRTGADVVMPLYPLTPHHTWQEAHRLVLDLYRRTVAEILQGIKAEVFAGYRYNPEEFIRTVTRLILEQKATRIVDHIEYNTIEGSYDVSIFATEKRPYSEAYEAEKAIQNYVFTDGNVERKFAQELDGGNEVLIYAILTLSGKEIHDLTANLMAPIVINATTRQAKQIVLDRSAYTTKHRLFPAEKEDR